MNSPLPYAINGRFLLQNMTGVQRYAFNVVNAMQRSVPDSASLPVIAPQSTPDVPGFQASIERKGAFSGHMWEQLSLPNVWPDRLLNLCNTAPLVKRNQVICMHDANVVIAPESYSAKFRAYYRLIQPYLARRAYRVATVSHASARQIARHLQIPLADIVVLPNGHEHALNWDAAQAEIAPHFVEQICYLRGRRFVLALGSRSPHKNLDLLIRAAPALEAIGVDILIAGGDAGIFERERLEERTNVHLLGRVPDADLAYLLDSALCLVFPSLTEGFGLPIIEAMARGCPVISSNLASMPEVCGTAALLASPFDTRQWVEHVKALCASPDLRVELIEKGFEQAERFSWAQTAQGYLDLMETSAFRQTRATGTEVRGLKVGVVFATRGRPSVVSATVRHLLETQTLKPDTVIVSCVDSDDAGDLGELDGVKVLTGPGGLPAQRNTGLSALSDEIDIVVFFDDDFIAHKDWLAVAAQTFQDEKQVVGFTGRVIADGIKGPGISFEDAVRAVEEDQEKDDASWIEPFSPYGCNMAFRMAAVASERFDERLVMYGWLEDRDFGATLARRGGQLVKFNQASGVHMGTKSGRVSGHKLGYSQIINPIYMLRKGTMSLREVCGQIFRNVASNLARAFRPEPFIDRRGRVKGNLLGLQDLLRGRLEPERAAALISPKSSVGLSGVEKQS